MIIYNAFVSMFGDKYRVVNSKDTQQQIASISGDKYYKTGEYKVLRQDEHDTIYSVLGREKVFFWGGYFDTYT